ncbi:MAG TPA: aspartyl protease family protein [Pyrinomonadaceae bacterium]|nr:aspartyl protease family protein [Pyrinomonadaceae bacterium]
MRKMSRPAVGVFVLVAFVVLASPGAATTRVVGDSARGRAERAIRDGDFEAAEKIYRELLSKDAHDNDSRLGLSHALLKQRKNQDAYDQAARVVAVDPTSARAHALLGSALLGAGDFRLSVEEFRTALSFKDNEPLAIAGLAMVDFYENRLDESLSGLRRAASIDPNEPDFIYNLGQVAARYERYAEAANAYEQFLRIAPKTDADRRARIRGLIDFLRYLGTQTNLLAAAGPDAVTLPFDLVNNRPIINVRVNGSKETLRFVIDTGAGMCVISTKAADKLGLKPVARGGLARAVGGAGRFEIVYGFLQSLHIGDARVERVPVYIRQFFNEQEPVDGYIGLSVLGKYLATVDYGARSMTLLRDDAIARAAAPAPGALEVPIRTTSSGFWSGEVSFDGLEKPANFIIDTGASVSVVSAVLAARAGLDRFAQAGHISVYGAAGLAENIETLMLPRVSLGALTRQNVYVAVLDMEPINETAGFEQTGIVGGNILRYYRATFDFARGIIRLEPLAGQTPTETNAKQDISS